MWRSGSQCAIFARADAKLDSLIQAHRSFFFDRPKNESKCKVNLQFTLKQVLKFTKTRILATFMQIIQASDCKSHNETAMNTSLEGVSIF